ncbi:DUF1062 domain-containing protein [Chryseobacterium kwangjuense]|uniref:RNA-binding S4 domain-containing protein n=1 Tax=Chryseobacterium kwangjuense TaxID=267125 RepID=A0A135WHH6_9FLAO|nr:DUF1062 domain-containing protein [Chryseobacterium kwangjuense]KXH84367.1 hypothetical protein AU378_00990 [Chryseobacterium kwangjuense]
MSTEYIWEINAKNSPLLKKKCNHCDSNRFQCSDKFRLNAQKKNIDIWLIYRCVECNNRYNLALFSRIRTESIPKDLFLKMSENNCEIAWQYAFSHEVRRKNNVEADLDSVEYNIVHEEISVNEMLHLPSETLTFKINYPFDFHLRMSAVIRRCLNLSLRQLEQLIDNNAVSVNERPLQKKHKIKNGDVITINRQSLIALLSKENH